MAFDDVCLISSVKPILQFHRQTCISLFLDTMIFWHTDKEIHIVPQRLIVIVLLLRAIHFESVRKDFGTVGKKMKLLVYVCMYGKKNQVVLLECIRLDKIDFP